MLHTLLIYSSKDGHSVCLLVILKNNNKIINFFIIKIKVACLGIVIPKLLYLLSYSI